LNPFHIFITFFWNEVKGQKGFMKKAFEYFPTFEK